jgi:cupin superfamily acireductone dioxygenase involved in methionine salvage
MTEPTESDDDYVCMVLEGEMYYDVEFDDDKWLRVHMQRGDLIVVPKGIYYRSTVTPTVSNFSDLVKQLILRIM